MTTPTRPKEYMYANRTGMLLFIPRHIAEMRVQLWKALTHVRIWGD